MKKSTALAALLCIMPLASPAHAADLPPPAFQVVELNPKPDAMAAELTKAARIAKSQGRTMYIELTTSWCTHCKKLFASMKHPAMIDAYAGTYIVNLDGDLWHDKLRQMGFRFRGVPTIFAMNAQGKWTGKAIDCGQWDEDVTVSMAHTLKQFFAENAWGDSTGAAVRASQN